MTSQTQQDLSKQDLLQQAHEAEQEERSIVDRLNSLPRRVHEAKQAAVSRYNVARGYLLAGQITEVPTLDLSEAQAILDSETEVKEAAKAAGLRKLRMYAAYHRAEEQGHAATYESLGEPLAELEAQHARITNELRDLQQARATVDKRRQNAWSEALSFERAATRAEQEPS